MTLSGRSRRDWRWGRGYGVQLPYPRKYLKHILDVVNVKSIQRLQVEPISK